MHLFGPFIVSNEKKIGNHFFSRLSRYTTIELILHIKPFPVSLFSLFRVQLEEEENIN